MSLIRKLPQEVINKIAAGEVVERPASALKELIENSIDAGAKRVVVKLKNYGKELIEISDDGSGMDEEDALGSLELHATSKISSEKDLDSIISYGFRGEALSTIKSASGEFILDTKRGDSIATKIIWSKNKISKGKSTKTTAGTIISIKDIFEPIPARRKFLKSDATEYRLLVNTFLDQAIVNHTIRFDMYHNDKEVYNLSPASKREDRLFDIYGKKFKEKLLGPVIAKENNISVEIYISNPTLAEKSAFVQKIYINNRPVSDKTVHQAISRAFSGLIHKDLKPSYLVLINIDPESVDVNIHPRKSEVRFAQPDSIFRVLYKNVRNFLEKREMGEIRNERQETGIMDIRDTKYDNTINAASFKPPASRTENNQRPAASGQWLKPKSPSSNHQSHQSSLFVSDIKFEDKYISNIENTVNESKPMKPFQIFNTYIAFEKDDELIIVDQHAAAEKILFEKILFSIGNPKSMPMLVPIIHELSPQDLEVVLEKSPELEKIGLKINAFGKDTIQITEIPEGSRIKEVSKLINSIIHEDENFNDLTVDYKDITITNELYYVIATTACHGSIRAGQRLSESEMLKIVEDLGKLHNPHSCPHGRPTRIEISRSEIEKKFKRIV